MRTDISYDKGVVTSREDDDITINGLEYHEAPFDQRWTDLYAFIDDGTGPAQLTYEGYRDTGFFMRFFRYNQDDAIFVRYQMPHGWDPQTDVYPHMHMIPMGSASGTVKMNFAYSWSLLNDGQLPAASGWISGSVSGSYTAADQYMQHVIQFGAIQPPASGSIESAILVFKVERPGSSDATDTYHATKDHGTNSANIGVLFFDLHYRQIKAGTVNQYPDGPNGSL